MATITVLQKPASKKITVEVDVDQWERLADALGFYQPSFLKTLRQSIKESKSGRVHKIKSLRDIEVKQSL